MNIGGMIFGFFLLALGVLIIKFGGRPVGDGAKKGGVALKMVSHSPREVKIIKWAVGLLVIWFGLALVFSRGQL